MIYHSIGYVGIPSAVFLPKPKSENGEPESKRHRGVNFLYLNESFPFLASLNGPKLKKGLPLVPTLAEVKATELEKIG